MSSSFNETDHLLRALAARIQRLEDIAAIEDLHRRYVRNLANRDWDAMHEALTDDAVVDLHQFGPRKGREEYQPLFDDLATASTTPDGYVLTSPLVDIEPGADVAAGEWTWHRFQCQFPMMGIPNRIWGPWWEGRYWCRYQRGCDGRWRFSAVKFRIIRPDAEPL